jgi:hypothetical protein
MAAKDVISLTFTPFSRITIIGSIPTANDSNGNPLIQGGMNAAF